MLSLWPLMGVAAAINVPAESLIKRDHFIIKHAGSGCGCGQNDELNGKGVGMGVRLEGWGWEGDGLSSRKERITLGVW